MDPMTIGLLLNTAQSIAGGISNYVKASAEADAMRQNARIADQNAELVSRQTDARQALQDRRAAQVLGQQRAAIVQGGMGTGGTMGQIAQQSGRDAMLDSMNIRYEGMLQRENLKYQARALRAQAKQTKYYAGWALATSLMQSTAGAYGGFQQAQAVNTAAPSNVMRNSVIPRVDPNAPSLI